MYVNSPIRLPALCWLHHHYLGRAGGAYCRMFGAQGQAALLWIA